MVVAFTNVLDVLGEGTTNDGNFVHGHFEGNVALLF